MSKEDEDWRLKLCEEVYGKPESPPDQHSKCYECDELIVASDDDAMVCIQCGGMSRRL